MFFVLSKLLTWLIMPTTLIVAAFVLSLLVKSIKWKNYTRWAGIGMLVLFTNPLIFGLMYQWWEVDGVRYDELKQSFRVGIVLSGMTDPYLEPNDRVHFTGGVDRLVQAAALYQKGKIEKILLSGGSGLLDKPEYRESHELAKILTSWGINPEDLMIEDQSNNTHENALYSQRLLASSNMEDDLLLITSAFHMRRAMACFRKVGLSPEPFATDFQMAPMDWGLSSTLIPSARALVGWSKLIKEWVGMVMYWLFGYI